ncbi:MAG: AsmA-like C-terminal domain-containing protein [Alphaproteobacteria bacterium]
MVRKINKVHKKLRLRRYVGICFLFLTLLFLWQLYRAPIAIPFLKPYIIKALNHDDADFEVSIDSVNLELVRSIKPIKIVASNVLYKNSSDSLKIDAPKISVSFSIQALLKGLIAPSSVEIKSPNIYIFKNYGLEDNNKQVSQKTINQKKMELYIEEFENFMDRFNNSEKIYSESYINSIDITNATFEFHEVDLGKKFVFSDMNYRFYRGISDIKINFSSFLEADDGLTSPFGVDLSYKPDVNQLGIELFASEFVPSKFLGETFGAEVNVPLSGKIKTTINLNEIIKNKQDVLNGFEKAISKIIFELEGANGGVVFDGLDGYVYNISQMLLKGDIQGGLDKLEIKNALFNLDNQKVAVSFYASGIKKLLLESSYEDLKLSINTKTNSLSFDRLADLWPKYISPKAWQWCKESISGGLAKAVNFNFNFAYDEKIKAIGFESLDGKVSVADANVHYLTGMPEIKNVYGSASFDNSSINIDIDKAVSDGVSLNGGFVKLYDLNTDNPAIDILLKATSSIPDALNLISHPPLELDKDLGISSDKINGFGEVELSLKFLLSSDLDAKDVDIDLSVVAEDVVVKDVLKEFDLQSSLLNLKLNNNRMHIYGDSVIDDVPVSLDWLEDFNKKDFKSRYKIAFKFNENLKKKLGLSSKVLSPPYIVGEPVVSANILVLKNNQTKVDLDVDLSQNVLNFPFLGIVKGKGQKAKIDANLNLADDKLKSIPYFSFVQPGFNLSGSVNLDKEGRVEKVNISDIKGEKTLASVVVDVDYVKNKPFYNINIGGDSYNLTKLFGSEEDKSYKGYTQKIKKKVEKKVSDGSLKKTDDAKIVINVNSLWTIDEMPIKNFVGSAVMKTGVGVEELHLVGNFDNKADSIIKVDYEPRGEDFFLDIDSTDAGATLKVLGLYDDMRDGRLKIQAKRENNKNFIGHAKIRDFRVYNAPALTRLLSVASLSGIVNMLTGEGLVFSHLDAPFEYKDDVLITKSAKASGNVMVITANGTFNRLSQVLNINGVIAPLKGLDSLLGNIPLIGSLLKGSDGTLFAANYKITGEGKDVKVSINPFSALSKQSAKDLRGVYSND